MSTRTILFGVFFSAITVACADPPPPKSPPPAAISEATMRTTCPLGVTNAHVVYDDTATGAKLTFSTTPDRLAELRERAHNASALHGNGEHVGQGHDGKHGLGSGRHGIRPNHMPPSTAGVEDTPDGARLIITPRDAKDLEELRRGLKARVEKMMTSCT